MHDLLGRELPRRVVLHGSSGVGLAVWMDAQGWVFDTAVGVGVGAESSVSPRMKELSATSCNDEK